jgi:hypothetical protein
MVQASPLRLSEPQNTISFSNKPNIVHENEPIQELNHRAQIRPEHTINNEELTNINKKNPSRKHEEKQTQPLKLTLPDQDEISATKNNTKNQLITYIYESFETIKQTFSKEKFNAFLKSVQQIIQKTFQLSVSEQNELTTIIADAQENDPEHQPHFLERIKANILNFVFKKSDPLWQATPEVYTTLLSKQLTDKQTKNFEKLIDTLAHFPAKSRPSPEKINDILQSIQNGTKIEDAIQKTNNSHWENIIQKRFPNISTENQTTLIKLLNQQPEALKLAENLNPKNFKTIRDCYLQLIVDVQWSLFKKAVDKNQSFSSGSITVIDPDEKYMYFLENYVKFSNQDYDISGRSWTSLTHNDAYNRTDLSTHWKGNLASNSKSDRIYGINVKFDNTYQQLLPANKDQLHFGRLKNGGTFIKWEDFGTTLNTNDFSMIYHAGDFLKSELNYGSSSALPKRGEKTSQDTKNKFKEIIKKQNIKLTPEHKKMMKTQGIAGMKDILKNNTSADKEFTNFLTTNSYDYTDLRKGNEVILNPFTN